MKMRKKGRAWVEWIFVYTPASYINAGNETLRLARADEYENNTGC